ncbi:MAG: peptidoglycan editing factor PgeF [Pseudomonadota bacterium]
MENNEIKVCRFDSFNNLDLVHGVFTRQGGTSTGAFDSLNVGMNSGDDTSAIAMNRKLIIMKMGMKPLVFLNQVHGREIKILKKDDNDLSDVFEPGKELYTADGIITDMQGVFLVIQVADCQAIMLFDPDKKVIANVHSGWRGSIENILGNCVDKMKETFGCRPENIMAGISPSLGPCCSEFINYEQEIPQALWKYKAEDSPCFDFWKMSIDQLTDKGVQKKNIENMQTCTKCNTDTFYSYRGEQATGRFACVIAMK